MKTTQNKLTVGQKVTDGDARDPINGEVIRVKGRQVQVRHWGRGALDGRLVEVWYSMASWAPR